MLEIMYVCVFWVDSYVMISDLVVIECPQECLNFSGQFWNCCVNSLVCLFSL